MNEQVNNAVAEYLASVYANPTGTIPIVDVVVGVRSLMSKRQRKRLKRSEVVNALVQSGVLIGVRPHDGRQAIVGYATDPPAALVVDEHGKIREAA